MRLIIAGSRPPGYPELGEGGAEMKTPPPNCTCLWTHSEGFGSIFIADRVCPAWPHDRTYSRREDETQER